MILQVTIYVHLNMHNNSGLHHVFKDVSINEAQKSSWLWSIFSAISHLGQVNQLLTITLLCPKLAEQRYHETHLRSLLLDETLCCVLLSKWTQGIA